MRYSRQPYEKSVDDLAKAMSGEGLQPPAPSAIPIADYYHAAELEIEQLLEQQRDQQERYRLILEHQKEAHRHIKHQSDGERMLQEDVERGLMTARGGSGRASALNSARLPPINPIGSDKGTSSPMLPPLFANRLPPKEEEKATLLRTLNQFLPSLLVPTNEEGMGPNSRSPRTGQQPNGALGKPTMQSPTSPGQTRLRHRSAKDQRLALLSQMTDPATGERVRVVENPYRRHREDREEAERRKHLQPHTTALLQPLSYDDASHVTDPFYVLKETQAMLKGRDGGGGGGGAFKRKGWTRESLLPGDRNALPFAPQELSEHIQNRLVASAPTSNILPQLRITPRQALTPMRQGLFGGSASPTMLGLDGSMSNNTVDPLLQMSQTLSPSGVDPESEERKKVTSERKAALKLWHSSKEEHLHQQERFHVEELIAQRQYYTVLNQRSKSIEMRMEAVQEKAIAAEEARGQELIRQAESRNKSNALEMLRATQSEEEIARQRLEAEENLTKNKFIILPFEAGMHLLRPSVPLLPSPAVGALPIDDTIEVDLMSLKNNNTEVSSTGRWGNGEGEERGEGGETGEQRQLRLPGMTNGRLALTTFVIGNPTDRFGIGRGATKNTQKTDVPQLNGSAEGSFVKVPSVDDDDELVPFNRLRSPPPRTFPLLKSPDDGKGPLGISPRPLSNNNGTPPNGASPRSSHSSPRNQRSARSTSQEEQPPKPEKIQYAKLKPIADDAPQPIKEWVTPFFNSPTPALTMRAIASSLGLMEPLPPEVEGGTTGDAGNSHPFQRVASLYASNSNIASNTPRPRGGMGNTRQRREKAQPLGFLGL